MAVARCRKCGDLVPSDEDCCPSCGTSRRHFQPATICCCALGAGIGMIWGSFKGGIETVALLGLGGFVIGFVIGKYIQLKLFS